MCSMLEGDINNIDGKYTPRLCLEIELISACGNIYITIYATNNINLLLTKLEGHFCTDLAAPNPYCDVLGAIFPSMARES